MRKIVIAGNWKMHKNQSESLAFVEKFKSEVENTVEGREIVLCAPFTSLTVMSKNLHGGRIMLGAQNIHWEVQGAYTGEISGDMLQEIGVSYVIVGHSERRQYFGETDKTVNLRLKAAQKSRFRPILCVGETKEQRDAGETENIIISQLENGLVG
ncbi:MAG: triose-phosphate isomerase family protein, partial [Pleurocapsa sp.]